MGLAKPGKTHGFTDTGLGLACHDAVGWLFGQLWNQTRLC